MAYCGFVTTLKNVHPHPNADRLVIGECFGNEICVDISYTEEMVGVYFPADGQLSVEFAEANNLLRKKDENGNNIGGYMDPDKRNVTAIKLRGEKSDGLFLPLSCLEKFGDYTSLKVGDKIDVFNGHEICKKYIPKSQSKRGRVTEGNRTRKKKVPISPLFAEHADTEQLAYNLAAFKNKDEIEITLKMHGTSQRTAYLPIFTGWTSNHYFWNKCLNCFKDAKSGITKKLYDKALNFATPKYEWGYVTGTRRTVLDNFDGGFYGSNSFREPHAKVFEGKLWKGEEVFYEVVGFTDTGTPIMASGDNKKLNDKEFIKQYGKTTVFSYGCSPTGKEGIGITERAVPQSDIYVYRMTMTNEDGDTVEYSPDFMRYRCEQMGVKTVPVLWRGFIPEAETFTGVSCEVTDPGEFIKEKAEEFYDGPDPIGKTHVREGVVVRILNRPKFCAYKHKNWSFKAIEGIVKVEASEPDMEEAQDCQNN